MKILIDGRWIKQTGIGRYIHQTLEQLLKMDTKNEYVLLVRTVDVDKVSLKAPNLSLLPTSIGWYNLKEQVQLATLIEAQKPDLVHFTNFNFPLRYRGKFVITIHDLTLLHFKNIRNKPFQNTLYYIKNKAMLLALRQGIKRAQTIFVPTEYVKEDIAKSYKIRRNKIVVSYQAGQIAYKRARVNLPELGINKSFLLYVGNAYPHKNLERLILAFGELVTKYMLDYQLVIAGKKDDFHQSLEEEVQNAGLKDRVVFTGFVDDAQLAGLYKAATAYVFPSLSEGFGLPGLEAMSYGLPVIASNATCLPEILGEAAVYFNPKSVNNMASVISEVLADKDKREKMVKKGYTQVKKYDWKKTANITLGVYEKVLNQKK
ncbi:glycosyltransferase family 4 protein [Candidatus Saccharibacteria bacterium]|nr:glycosyltransferase family 4 protein [Candidatus Saccharibacteria bacterium]